jgi:hypothetical protein
MRKYRLSTGALCLVAAVLAVASVGAASVGSPRLSGRSVIPPAGAGLPTEPWAEFPTDAPETTPPTTAVPGPTQPPNARPPQNAAPPPAKYQGPPATNPAEAVAAAAAVGAGRGERVAVDVLDLRTGTSYTAGDVDGAYASASVVKVFIATRLLVEGKASDAATLDKMWRMITLSDDNAANSLYYVAGAEGLTAWIASRYRVGGLRPATMPGWWGLTRITARAMVNFYAAVANDPAVAPWLLNAMANAQTRAADGFAQLFGLPAAAHSWKVKQGWMCCLDNLTRMHSTGYIDGNRYAVALLTEGSRSVYGTYGSLTLTLMAQALLPGGAIPQPAPVPTTPPPTTPPPTPTPTPTGSPLVDESP